MRTLAILFLVVLLGAAGFADVLLSPFAEVDDAAALSFTTLGSASGERQFLQADSYLFIIEGGVLYKIDTRDGMKLEGSVRYAESPTPPWTGAFIRPVPGAVTSGFGPKFHPITRVIRNHTGVDMHAPQGAPILAAAPGEVVLAGWNGGYGNAVIIDHGGGVSTLYAHCSELLVCVGDRVSQGQTIAKVGSTGYATGPHLHFEKRINGEPVNPL